MKGNEVGNCSDFTCTSLYFGKYLLNLDQINSGSCDYNFEDNSNIDAAWYKGCKESVFSVTTGKMGRPCVTDRDCVFPWGNNSTVTYQSLGSYCSFETQFLDPPPCDTIHGVCSDTIDISEEIFWWCFVSNMSTDVQLSIYYRSADPCNVTSLKETYSAEDCVSLSGTGMSALSYRSHFEYVSPDS